MFPDAGDIARLVSVPQMLNHLGWRLRQRGRFDCGLCKGNSKGTLAYREHVWHCHRCHAGGDVYSLVRAVHKCDFPDALRYVADLAGVHLDDCRSADVRREIAARKRQHESLEYAAQALEQAEHELRFQCCDRIHLAERRLATLSDAIAWTERDWLTASECWGSLQRDLPAYTLLSWGALHERARYVLHPNERGEMVAAVLWAGGVRADDGHYIEAPR
jgi:hypothetical protein